MWKRKKHLAELIPLFSHCGIQSTTEIRLSRFLQLDSESEETFVGLPDSVRSGIKEETPFEQKPWIALCWTRGSGCDEKADPTAKTYTALTLAFRWII